MDWQPIDTAPKDGDTDILVYGPDGFGCLVVHWDLDPKQHRDWPWATLDGPNYHVSAFTHWMPLPEPPVKP